MDTVSGFAATISDETTEITVAETAATADEAEAAVTKTYAAGGAALDGEKVQKFLSALTALERTGATVSPDTDRPLIALTFHREDGDVSLTLYAFDTESALADVNGEIGLLVQREDAENIVDLTLAMLKTE